MNSSLDSLMNDVIRDTRKETVLSQLMHYRPSLLDGIKIAYENDQSLDSRVKYGNLITWLRLLKEETNNGS